MHLYTLGKRRIESIIGVFMNLICIARFINMLPEVKSMSSN